MSNYLQKAAMEFLGRLPEPVLYINESGVLLYHNEVSKNLLESWCCGIGYEVPQEILSSIQKAYHTETVELEFNERLYSFVVIPREEDDSFFLFGSDITEKREIEVHLNKLATIIEESINIIYITDYEGNIEYVNNTFEEITGYKKEGVIGKNPRILASGETNREEYKDMWEKIKNGDTWRGLLKNKKKNGEIYWVNGFISPIKDENNNITNFMAIQEDVTEKIAIERQLNYLSEYDNTTGLINREKFLQLSDEFLNSEKLYSRGSAMLLINIDGFKLINDSMGWKVGDKFLKEFSDFLLKQIRDMDIVFEPVRESIVARLAGDEFAVFLTSRQEEESFKAAETLREKTEENFFLSDAIRTTVSIGIALYPIHGENSYELLSKASAALSIARKTGRNRSFLYQEEKDDFEKAGSKLEEKQLILQAIEEDRFVPWFQPIFDLRSEKITHYEALARLIMPGKKVLSPASFIPKAERYGLIYEIDEIITRKSIFKQAEFIKEGYNFYLSMNLSGKYLEDERMLHYLQRTIKEVGADPEYIIFEITETAAINNLSDVVYFVKNLKELGCKVSLDDFGVGFTSFVHLIEMEIDYVKIDGAFIRNLPDSERNQVLVKTIVNMAKSLGIKTVAEFVENEKTVKVLKEIGVDFAQGYFIGKPSSLFF